MTMSEPAAVTPFASVTLKVSVNVPFTCSVTLKVPVPWYGVVPPVADTVQSNGLPAVIPAVEDPQVTVTTRGCGTTFTLAEPEAVTLLASVTLNDSVNVPLTGSVTWKVPVPEYGVVPPVAETTQLKGLPAVIATVSDPHVTVTTKGCGATMTLVEPEAVTPLASVTLNDSVKAPLTCSVIENVPVPE